MPSSAMAFSRNASEGDADSTFAALFGGDPRRDPRSRERLASFVSRHGRLKIVQDPCCGERPNDSFGEDSRGMGRRAAYGLGEHLGSLHAATERSEGFGPFGGDPIRWTQWWPRFARSYATLADDVCAASPLLGRFRLRLNEPLAKATRSPDPRAFPLICADPRPSRYVCDAQGHLVAFRQGADHAFAPAEWELTVVLVWMPHPKSFRRGYEGYRRWPDAMDDVRDAYVIHTMLERIARTRRRIDDPLASADIEAWILGELA